MKWTGEVRMKFTQGYTEYTTNTVNYGCFVITTCQVELLQYNLKAIEDGQSYKLHTDFPNRQSVYQGVDLITQLAYMIMFCFQLEAFIGEVYISHGITEPHTECWVISPRNFLLAYNENC